MMRMLKLRDLGILSHYTKKEGGTFSFYVLSKGDKELLYIKKNSIDDINNGYEQANNYDINEQDDNQNVNIDDNLFTIISALMDNRIIKKF